MTTATLKGTENNHFLAELLTNTPIYQQFKAFLACITALILH